MGLEFGRANYPHFQGFPCLQMYNKAEEFISNTTLKLREWEDLGHDKCYRTEEYDVRLCHEDCKKREKGDFAKKCKKDGGLFKCCVRYENIHQRVMWNKMVSASKASL